MQLYVLTKSQLILHQDFHNLVELRAFHIRKPDNTNSTQNQSLKNYQNPLHLIDQKHRLYELNSQAHYSNLILLS